MRREGQSWEQQQCYSRECVRCCSEESLALDLPQEALAARAALPRKQGWDPWLGAGSSTSPSSTRKKRNHTKQNPAVLQQQIKGPPNQGAPPGQRGEGAGKTDDPWSKGQGADMAVPCPAGFSCGFCRCFDYPAGLASSGNEGSALHWGPAPWCHFLCGPGGHWDPCSAATCLHQSWREPQFDLALRIQSFPSHLVFLCLHLLIFRGEGDIFDAAADNGNRGDGCQINS